MSHLDYLVGELTELQRYINVPLRWCEQYPARERREFWLTRLDGRRDEIKLVVHARSMPARRGHQVCVLLQRGTVLGMANLTTGHRINFVRADPPLLLRRCDALAAIALLLAGALLGTVSDAPGFWLSLPLAVLYPPVRALGRLLWRTGMQRKVDQGLEAALDDLAVAPPRLRRVK